MVVDNNILPRMNQFGNHVGSVPRRRHGCYVIVGWWLLLVLVVVVVVVVVVVGGGGGPTNDSGGKKGNVGCESVLSFESRLV